MTVSFFMIMFFYILFIEKRTPGPGEYTPKVSIDGSGIMYLSRYKSSTAKSLGGRLKELSNKNVTPGPGAYSTFSEFGFVDTKYAKRYRESQEKSIKNSCEKTHRKSSSNGFVKFKKESFNRDYLDKENNDKNLTKYYEDNGEVKNKINKFRNCFQKK